jgi:hypothetical protein
MLQGGYGTRTQVPEVLRKAAMPYDGQRMIYRGFAPIIDARPTALAVGALSLGRDNLDAHTIGHI